MEPIEKLTEDEREAVRRGTCPVSGPKALRIIDPVTAALEAAERTERYLRQRLETDVLNTRSDRNLAEARAEALQARVAELEAELDAARDAEADLAQMRGRVVALLNNRDISPGRRIMQALEALRGR